VPPPASRPLFIRPPRDSLPAFSLPFGSPKLLGGPWNFLEHGLL